MSTFRHLNNWSQFNADRGTYFQSWGTSNIKFNNLYIVYTNVSIEEINLFTIQ